MISLEEANKRFSNCNLTIVGEYISSIVKVKIRCYCDKIFEAFPKDIFSKNTKSCGCHRRFITSKINTRNLVGQKFHRLTVLELLPRTNKYKKYLCLCDCGNKTKVTGRNLPNGHTKSCGCLHIESISGKNSKNYKHELTEEDRIDRRCLPQNDIWTKAIFERDNYVCQICGPEQTILNAHHLYSYGIFEEGRFLLENGITLCKACHDDFHYLYGNRYNTKEEFEEYIWNYS